MTTSAAAEAASTDLPRERTRIESPPPRPRRTVTGRGARASLFVAIALLASAVAPGLGGAQSGTVPSTLAGTWAYDGSAARAMAIVEAAFASGISTLPELFQGLARDRIRSSMRPPARIVVTLTGPRVRVVLEAEETTTIEGALGARASTTGVSSSTTVTSGLRGGWLELTYDGEGDMTQLFSTEPDGSRMHVDYTVVSDRLPAPVRYRLDYLRPPS